MEALREVFRVVITLALIGLVIFLYNLAFSRTPVDEVTVGTSNLATAIITAVVAHWLGPAPTPRS